MMLEIPIFRLILIKKLQGLMALAKPLQIIWPTGSLLMQPAKQGHCHASHTYINSLALVLLTYSNWTSFVIDKIHCLSITQMLTLNEVPFVSVSSRDTVDNVGKLKIGKGAWLNLINVAWAKILTRKAWEWMGLRGPYTRIWWRNVGL